MDWYYQLVPTVHNLFRFAWSHSRCFYSKLNHLMIHFICIDSRQLNFDCLVMRLCIIDLFLWGGLGLVKDLHFVPGKEILVFAWRYHRLIFHVSLSQVDQTRLILFEIEMDENQILPLWAWLRNGEFEDLLMPSFANPADVFKLGRFESFGGSGEDYIITVDFLWHDRM